MIHVELVPSVIFVFFFFFKQKTAYEMLRSLVGSEMCIRDRFRYCYSVKNTRAAAVGGGDVQATSNTNTRLLVRDQYPLSEDKDCVVGVVEPKIKKVATSSSASSTTSNRQPFSYTSIGTDGRSMAVVDVLNSSTTSATQRAPPPMSSVETTETHEIVWTLENLVAGEERMFNYVFTVEHGTDMETSGL
eukprot:TRINITY_DN15904_c0_g1_i6.p1 TRINITY_DN15904_c0_g1~~TRINITY_DN15904_c0_g1_i6.p1  ORF type:complete len:189 (-),score=63.12 TRINITY_DN15904_c0_g1_i6:60-626(-)